VHYPNPVFHRKGIESGAESVKVTANIIIYGEFTSFGSAHSDVERSHNFTGAILKELRTASLLQQQLQKNLSRLRRLQIHTIVLRYLSTMRILLFVALLATLFHVSLAQNFERNLLREQGLRRYFNERRQLHRYHDGGQGRSEEDEDDDCDHSHHHRHGGAHPQHHGRHDGSNHHPNHHGRKSNKSSRSSSSSSSSSQSHRGPKGRSKSRDDPPPPPSQSKSGPKGKSKRVPPITPLVTMQSREREIRPNNQARVAEEVDQ
jgi:hypothetical protein